MTEGRACPQCGAELPVDAPEGPKTVNHNTAMIATTATNSTAVTGARRWIVPCRAPWRRGVLTQGHSTEAAHHVPARAQAGGGSFASEDSLPRSS